MARQAGSNDPQDFMKALIDEINNKALGLDIEIQKSETEHSGSHSIELVESLGLDPDLDLGPREET